MSDDFDPAPGFFGKVTTHGDFVSRRLPPMLLSNWDVWLQSGLQGSREQLGPRWLEVYLTSPIWRFVLAPGVCGNRAWAGVLMPSVDRVGRHFPLTIAASAAGDGALLDWIGGGKEWFDQLEDLALSSLSDGFVLEQFDAALLAMEPLPDGDSGLRVGAAGCRIALEGLDALPAQITPIALAALRGHSLWWTDGSEAIEPSLLMCRGLPAPAAFGGMLAGSWGASGWMPPG
jgi:type VI secretion system protein ImpM